MTEQTPAAADASKKTSGQFTLMRLYTKDVSFEAPGAPQVFTQEWKPETKVQFNSGATRVGDNQYEVVLMLNVVTQQGDKVAYIAEVKQAGIFLIDVPEPALETLLHVHCPSILYPYACEAITSLVTRGSFPQVLLQPMNFEAIYASAKQRQQAAAAETAKH